MPSSLDPTMKRQCCGSSASNGNPVPLRGATGFSRLGGSSGGNRKRDFMVLDFLIRIVLGRGDFSSGRGSRGGNSRRKIFPITLLRVQPKALAIIPEV